jgi:hypothetical protein
MLYTKSPSLVKIDLRLQLHGSHLVYQAPGHVRPDETYSRTFQV